jgi:hypothetical protein
MKLRKRVSIAAIATAAAAGLSGTFLVPAASARTASHTLAFTSVQQATAHLSPAVSVSAHKDVSKAGKVIGYDILRFSPNRKTGATSIGVAVGLKGGYLYGVLRESNGPAVHGTVTGGTGTYRGATGTITARPLNQNGSRTAVTITYRT